jgi:acetyl-CoA carboxylase carboxyltransferase component
MGPAGAIEILEGKTLKSLTTEIERTDFINAKEKEYRDKFANPYEAAKYGYIDDVIEPRNTRFRVIRAFRTLATKKDTNPLKKHGNIPL